MNTTATPQVRVISFGFGHDLPTPEADLVVDVREWFRDPHLRPEMRYMTGLDAEVHTNVMIQPGAARYVDTLVAAARTLVDLGLPRTVTIAVGCVGGRHRSVVRAAELHAAAQAAGLTSSLEHRDVQRPVLTRTRTAPVAEQVSR